MSPRVPLAIPPLSPSGLGTAYRWPIPGSKSITNRALMLAALSPEPTLIANALVSDDTGRMVRCLGDLGIVIEPGPEPTSLLVRGGIERLRPPAAPLRVGNSGTTVRFLAALALVIPGPVTLIGDDDMARRPIQDLVTGLSGLGASVDCPTGCPPLTISGPRRCGASVTIRADRSSQYVTALMLIGAALPDGLEITLDGEAVSQPYLAMTSRMLGDFGVGVETLPHGYLIRPGPVGRRGGRYRVEPDASSASYAFATAAATGAPIAVDGLDGSSLQGDYGFLDILRSMGAEIRSDAGSTTVCGAPGGLAGVDADLHHISDTVMTLAAIAPLLHGPTTIRNVANIRIKETDRLRALTCELRRLGQDVDERPDGLTVHPRPLRPGIVECYRDHRIAMAFAVLGAAAPEPVVAIADPGCTAKTYPGFWNDLAGLYHHRSAPVPW